MWLDLDQKELDDAYDQSAYASNMEQMNRRRATESDRVRAHLGEPKRVAYGTTHHQMLDIYSARNSGGISRARAVSVAASRQPFS